MDLTLLLEMAVSGDPERVALGSLDDGTSYAELDRVARRIGARLAETGAERVALLDLNSSVTPLLLFGCAAAGLPLAPMSFRLTDEQIAAAAERLAPVTVVAGAGFAQRVAERPGITVMLADDLVAHGVAPGDAPDLAPGDPERPAVLLATSGTTGTPKDAVLRHRHLASYIVGSVEFWSAGADEAILVSVPNYHVAGITSVLSSVYSGRRLVMLPQFDATAWVETAAAERVTHAMVVPTMLGRVLDVLEATGERLPALRHLSYGGGRMPLPTIERALALLPHVGFVNAYGLTETSSTIAVLGPQDHRDALAGDDPGVRLRLGSVGRPLPTVELEIRDADGQVVTDGRAGEVVVRGDQISGEYRTHSVLDADGWYHTRDRGRLDAGGFLYVEGRVDDVIVRGGENLSPGEIEDVLLEHPGVVEVAVVGVPDTEWGERVEVAVVRRPEAELSPEELQEWVRARLRSAKVPARVHWRETLPYSETGKLLRRVLVSELSR